MVCSNIVQHATTAELSQKRLPQRNRWSHGSTPCTDRRAECVLPTASNFLSPSNGTFKSANTMAHITSLTTLRSSLLASLHLELRPSLTSYKTRWSLVSSSMVRTRVPSRKDGSVPSSRLLVPSAALCQQPSRKPSSSLRRMRVLASSSLVFLALHRLRSWRGRLLTSLDFI